MRTTVLAVLFFVSAPVWGQETSPASSAAPNEAVNWPQFRGPGAGGVAEGYKTPTKWNAEKSFNIKWKTRVPGNGNSSPIIWGDRLFLTTSIDTPSGNVNHTWKLMCLDKNDGRFLWERPANRVVPDDRRRSESNQANSTPATDGRRIVAVFGSDSLYCFDMGGKLLWTKDLGALGSGYYGAGTSRWKLTSSPIIFRDKVILQCDVQQNPYLAVLDIRDGKEIRRIERNDAPAGSTPNVHVAKDRVQVIVNGHNHIGGYDLQTGEALWKIKDGGNIAFPTPVVSNDLIYITSARGPRSPLFAVYPDAAGDLGFTNLDQHSTDIAWGRKNGGNYRQTPIAYRDLLFACRNSGLVTIYDAQGGETFDMAELGTGRSTFSASPVAADGKIYFTKETGEVFVVEADSMLGIISINRMGETCIATPAISEGKIYIRGENHLFCIAK